MGGTLPGSGILGRIERGCVRPGKRHSAVRPRGMVSAQQREDVYNTVIHGNKCVINRRDLITTPQVFVPGRQ